VATRAFRRTTIAAWSVIALVSSAELYLFSPRSGPSLSFGHALAIHAPAWAVWALATAPVVALSRRFPFERPLRPRAVALHLAACAATAAAFSVVFAAAAHAFPYRPSVVSLPRELWNHVVSWAPFLLMAYASLVGIGHALTYAERYAREKAEKATLAAELAAAQLAALRMQLQPHFLFNTLNSIAMLVRSDDAPRAVEMIVLLGDVLRALLRTSSDLEATLASEADLLRRYLAIEQIRFGDRLRVTWRIDDAAARAQVPPLLLQPIVENALRHGLWPAERGGELAISAHRSGDALELEVRDTGVGVPAGFDPARSSGVGLANVCARLAKMYGAAGALEITAASPHGTRVRLRLPYRADGAAAGPPGVRDA
jgi:two-component system LytT family sensor kinase